MRPLHIGFYAVLAIALATTPAFARGGGGGGGARGGGGGGARGGGVARSGGFAGGGRVGGFSGGRVGGFVGARPGYGGYRGGYGYGRGWGYGGWGIGLGWGYPYYAWGYPYYGYCDPVFFNCGYYPYDYDYGYTYAPQPAYPAPQSYAPPVSGPTVINEYNAPGYSQYPPQSYSPNGNYVYNTPNAAGSQSYSQNAASQQPAVVPRSVGTHPMIRAPEFYLIAFTNHTIQTAISFHVQGNTLYYTTREHVEKTAPLSTVDLRFSQQINRDRHVDFQLPRHDDTPALKTLAQ